MRRAEIEVVRYKRETNKVIVLVPDELDLNIGNVRNLGQDLLTQGFLKEDNWETDVEEYAGSWFVREVQEGESDVATVLLELNKE